MTHTIEVDYLVVGAGLAGMAITDELLAHSDATIAIVDRRHTPGGHWVDAYPFVRLHQPSAFYGVSSVPLEHGDTPDRSGLNEGLAELASADELRAYFAQVMRQVFLPSGRVRYFPCSDYRGGDAVGSHTFASRLTGERSEVRVRRKLVDTTYLEGEFPATSAPLFEVADGVRCCAAGEVVHATTAPTKWVIVGGGKTALDTCVWLLGQGVAPSAIRWIKPREGWWPNRRFHQPGIGLPEFYAAVATQLEAFAQADSVGEVLQRLEAEGFFLRVDTSVAPTMMRGAILSERECDLLRRIDDVVRLGHVRRIERERIVLDHGEVPTEPGALHVHCAARGLARRPLRPVFGPGRLTVQPTMWSFSSLQFALLGAVEALLGSDDEKNRLCPPIAYWDDNTDYLGAYLALMQGEQARAAHPALDTWARQTRLNPLAQIAQHRDHPVVAAARERMRQFAAPAAANLARLRAAARPASSQLARAFTSSLHS